ncbi:MAG: hypothetical protein UIT85_02525 [Treponema sp.]|nr:hypothetical protein [Treponema sp.]
MSIKNTLKLFIPPVIILLLRKIKQRLHMSNEKIISTISLMEKGSDTLCILGNGPSLVGSCNKYKDFISRHDVIGVNFLCITDVFTQVKPSIYVIADPAFFHLESQGENEKFKQFKKAFFGNTTWNMKVVIPDFAAESEFCSLLKQNEKFKVYFYNTRNYSSNENIFEQHNRNQSTPPARNVLNLALYLSIFLKYKEVYLFGAENSFMNDLHVDQDDNRLYFTYRHFYDKVKREYLYYDNDHPERGTKKLHEFLSEHSKTMKLYWDLLEYSNYNNVKIYNASEYSLIDAFERRKPE